MPAPQRGEQNGRFPNVRNQTRLRGRPRQATVEFRFKKGQSGNPRGPFPKNRPALLVEAIDEKVTVTIDGERREITKREAVATQLVSVAADGTVEALESEAEPFLRAGCRVGMGADSAA